MSGTVMLETGSCASGMEVFYWLTEVSPNGAVRASWTQPIPGGVELAEGEYYALIKGLRVAIERGYSMVDVATNSSPILDQLRGDRCPSDELRPFYEMAVQLIEQLDEVNIMAYAVDMSPSG